MENTPCVQAILHALRLPPESRVDRRVPKKMLLENGRWVAADKRRMNEEIGELHWVATLKPETIGIPAYVGPLPSVLEIPILRMLHRGGGDSSRVAELVHRAIPYPLLLLTEEAERLHLSLAAKRPAENETGRWVLDGELVQHTLIPEQDLATWDPWLAELPPRRPVHTTLRDLYLAWMRALLALRASRLTGRGYPLVPASDLPRLRESLSSLEELDAEISRLRAAAAKERQIPRQVDLNMEVKRRERERAALVNSLYG
jgi:hypothetical protein